MSSSSPASSPWEPPLPEELQRMLPQYEILGILGRGGMGAVYKGRQAKLSRTVAIKVLPETFTQGDDQLNFAKRFEQEAKAMANLDHPAILSVYDFGETAEGQLYFVMEFVDGMDIHQYLKHHGGKLPQEHALSICAHVLDALGYAHAHGIVHRDIKPANILLNREGRVKIADFGLAKRFGDHADADAPALTMSNVAVGTPDFVAPEALDSDQVPDHRADLYAVGVMLYQMLTGKLPRGNYQMPSELNPEVDPRLDEIVSTAMAANPDYRYSSAGAVRADLDLVLSGPLAKVEAGEPSGAVVPVVPVTSSLRGKKAPKKSSTKPLILGLGAAALVIAGLVVLLAGKRGEPESLPANLPEVIVEKSPELTVTASAPAVPVPVAAPVKTPEPVAKAEPPRSEPKPAEAPASPVAVVEKKAEVTAAKPESPPVSAPVTPTADPLADLPGLQTRLNGYLSARKTQLTELATKYGRGLDSRLNQAADTGDLKLTAAYDEEKARVAALVSSLASPLTDPRAAVSQVPALPELPGDAPETLVTLRQAWTSESGKILATLDGALQQSLQALESELTRARDLDNAKAVLAYRESLGEASSKVTSVGQAEGRPALRLPQQAAGAAALQSSTDLARATKDAPFENSLGMKFVPVPGTDVLFCIHEVRYKDYKAYAAENPGIDGAWKGQTIDGCAITERAGDHPVVQVSWEDARKFCEWLSKKEGMTYRMPNDEEWSAAVGLGRKERRSRNDTPQSLSGKVDDLFPWGTEWPPPAGSGNYSDLSSKVKTTRADANFLEGYDDGYPTTAPVMSFAPNEFGLHDMGGNMWEWCEDWSSNEQKARVLRGASWANGGRDGGLLSSKRILYTPGHRDFHFGFRVVVAPASSALAGADPTPPPIPPAAARPLVPDPALARATKDVPFENTLGMKFVPVTGTDVLFCIHEVRYKDYAAYAAKTQGIDGTWKDQSAEGFTPTDRPEDHPVMRVSWDDAQKFCAWLSEKEGKTYRLPTDQEWSRAVGIGEMEDWKDDTTPSSVFKNQKEFPWGDEWPPPQEAGNFSDLSRNEVPFGSPQYLDGYDDTFPRTAPAMSFGPNKIGLFDMSGNVWEWCEDWYSREQTERVLRGGSWAAADRPDLLSSGRRFRTPDEHNSSQGFRVVVEIATPAVTATVAAPPTTRPVSPSPSQKTSVTTPDLARATKDAPFENSLGMKFVPVSGTDVLFCIHETRYRDYAVYAEANPTAIPKWKLQIYEGFTITDRPEDHPVAFVNWQDAQDFCSWLSQKEGKTYRLPTDREWSIAVGIGRTEKWKSDTTPATVFKDPDEFPWGNDWPPPSGGGNYSDESRKLLNPEVTSLEGYDDGFPTSAPVMSFSPNPLGLYDLGGNVLEWCEDFNSDDQKSRVLRGGSWHFSCSKDNYGALLSSFRHAVEPVGRHHHHGFRVVLVPSDN